MLTNLAEQIIDELDLPVDFRDSIKSLLAEQALLHASLCELSAHWRKFGPDLKFAALIHDIEVRHGLYSPER